MPLTPMMFQQALPAAASPGADPVADWMLSALLLVHATCIVIAAIALLLRRLRGGPISGGTVSGAEMAASGLSTQQHILVETRLANEGKTFVIAYVFWFFLGFFSAHRFYLRDGAAVVQLILNFLVVGLIWTLLDVFLIPEMVRKTRDEARRRIVSEVKAYTQP